MVPIPPAPTGRLPEVYSPPVMDLSDVQGQYQARRALEIAASGGHSLLLTGPPGTGKTLLASRLPSILPPLTEAQALEVAALRSISGQHRVDPNTWRIAPFRNPHHTASAVALVGGSSPPKPGEISLAHHGVLFLDELPEFNRSVLESLREPMESGTITISRAARTSTFPAQFQFISAMNPCPCGHYGDPTEECRCSVVAIQNYRNRISGPLLTRIDLQVIMPQFSAQLLLEPVGPPPENSETVRERVILTREIQLKLRSELNCHLSGKTLKTTCMLTPDAKATLSESLKHKRLSARAYHRTLRVARTIADMEDSETIQQHHVMEALMYRMG